MANTYNISKSLNEAKETMITWLTPFGLSLEIDTDNNEELDANQLGSYEAGSVFEKEILIHVNPTAIKKACDDDPWDDKYSDVNNVAKTTVYHEVGHALVEQIIDWMENLPESATVFTESFCQKYDAVIDDALPEEDLVEDFAWNILDETDDPLKNCFEELNRLLNSSKN